MNSFSLRSLLFGVVLSCFFTTFALGAPLTIQAPEPDAVIIGNMVSYSGYTSLSGHVMVNGIVVRVDQWGHFRGKLRAALGENQIRFSVVDGKTGEVLELKRRVICLQHYSDLSGHWARQPVQLFATYLGLGGMNARNFFYPDHELKRWELMDWIARAYELPLRWPKTPRYTDVLPSDRFYSVVETVADRFNIEGSSELEFSPDGFVSRADFVRILIKVAQVREFYSYTGWANDVSRRFWGASYIETAKQLRLLPPHWTEGDMLFPYRPVTRSEAVYALSTLPEMRSRLAVLRPREDVGDANVIVTYSDPRHKVRQMKETARDIADEVADATETFVDASELAVKDVVDVTSEEVGKVVTVAKTESASLSTRVRGAISSVKTDMNNWLVARKAEREQAALEQEARETELRIAAEQQAQLAAEEAVNREAKAALDRASAARRESEDQARLVAEQLADESELPDSEDDEEPVIVAEPGAVIAKSQPKKEAEPDSRPDQLHTIQPGDTLPKISKQYTGSYRHWEAIAQYNEIPITRIQTEKGESLRVNIILGRTIKIPGRLIH
ncbi:MAG: LysM peptidoglycan-binding domain-containing protein [bacterium]|nr:LysM peptidoglycan-binding domain-containing protein [bacterium]